MTLLGILTQARFVSDPVSLQDITRLGAFFTEPSDPADVRQALFKKMNGTERLMLSTDGSFTELLKDMYGEPIRPHVQSQVTEEAAGLVQSILSVAPQTPVWRRIVRLKTVNTDQDVTFAESLIVPSRLPASVRQGLEDGDKPIGFLIRAARMETLRLLIDWGLCPEQSDAYRWLTGGQVVFRSYCIMHKAQPIMCVSEYFPIGITVGSKQEQLS